MHRMTEKEIHEKYGFVDGSVRSFIWDKETLANMIITLHVRLARIEENLKETK